MGQGRVKQVALFAELSSLFGDGNKDWLLCVNMNTFSEFGACCVKGRSHAQ